MLVEKHVNIIYNYFVDIYCYNPERVARFWACVSQALTKMVSAFAVIHLFAMLLSLCSLRRNELPRAHPLRSHIIWRNLVK